MTSSLNGPRPARGKLVLWFALSLVASVFTLAATFGTVLYSEQRNIRGQRVTAEEMRVSLASRTISEELKTVRGHAQYLARSPLAGRIFDSDERTSVDLEQDWIEFARSVDLYEQVRLLDTRGREVLRINHPAGGAPTLAARGQLRDKSDRPYFREAVGLSAGQLYVSPFDLSVEQSRIEKPHKPVLRFATPVFRNGRVLGVLVLHFRGQRLIDSARAAIDSNGTRLMLLNSQGYWMAAPNPQDEWGFMFGEDRTLALRNPALWQAMSSSSDGRFADAEGVYLYRTIHPLADSEKPGAHGTAPASSHDYSLKLVSWIPAETFEAQYSVLRRKLAWLFAAALVLVLPLAGAAAVLRARRGVSERDQRLAARVFEATGDAMLVTDRKFRIIRMNPAFSKLTGFGYSQVAGAAPEALLSRSRMPDGMREQFNSRATGSVWEGILWFRCAGGGDLPVWASVSQVVDQRNVTRNCVLMLSDMSERIRDEEKMRLLSERDALTGLPSRRLLTDRLEQAVARARRANTQLAVLLLNLDRFRKVNDGGGHDAGDAVLQAIAHRLASMLRVTDTTARLGGDEFVVVLEAVGDYATAEAVARKLVASVAQPVEFAGREYSVNATVVIKLFPEDGDNPAALLRAADREMRTVKAARQPALARAA